MSRFQCTPERPWTRDDPEPVEHSQVEEIGNQSDGYPGGDIVRYRCKNCGTTWKEELPQ